VSCASAGNCGAAGFYATNNDLQPVFVAGQTNGTWGTAIEVPGINTLNKGFAVITSVSCGSVAHCSAGGLYTDRSDRREAFIVSETEQTPVPAAQAGMRGT